MAPSDEAHAEELLAKIADALLDQVEAAGYALVLRRTSAEEKTPLIARAKELWEQGKTQKEIGQAIGRSQTFARKLLIEAGVDTGKKPPRINAAYEQRMERLADVLHLRESGKLTFRAIGQKHGTGAARASQLYRKALRLRATGRLCVPHAPISITPQPT